MLICMRFDLDAAAIEDGQESLGNELWALDVWCFSGCGPGNLTFFAIDVVIAAAAMCPVLVDVVLFDVDANGHLLRGERAKAASPLYVCASHGPCRHCRHGGWGWAQGRPQWGCWCLMKWWNLTSGYHEDMNLHACPDVGLGHICRCPSWWACLLLWQ